MALAARSLGGRTYKKSIDTESEKKDHETYAILDESGEDNHLTFEVNWNDSVKPATKIRLTDKKSGKYYIIDRNQLLSIMFIISDEGDQMQFMKETLRQITVQRRAVEIGPLTREHHKGEMLTVYVDVPIEISDVSRRMSADNSPLLKK